MGLGTYFMVAAGSGLLLAVRLLVAVMNLDRSPGLSLHRLEGYARWKGMGGAATALALFWSALEIHWFWVAATRHVPVGSGPPVIETAVLLAFALLPMWWVRKALRGGRGKAFVAGAVP